MEHPPSARRSGSARGSARRWRIALARNVLAALATVAVSACDATPGPPGAPGQDGADGNANVIYSDWTPFSLDGWSPVSNYFGLTQRTFDVAVPEIDEALLSSGVVLVYVRFGGTGDTIFPLPYQGRILTVGGNQVLKHEPAPGRLRIAFHNAEDDGLDPGRIGSGNSFRYVLIPGGTPIETVAELNAQVLRGADATTVR